MIQADSVKGIPLKDKSVDCVISSPPYWGLRTYGEDDNELGQGDLDDYISDLLLAFRHIGRCLNDNGVVWLNLGDTYSGSGGAGGDHNSGIHKGKLKYKQGKSNVVDRSLCMVPSQIAIALMKREWVVRSEIIWDKQRVKPEDINHVRRPLLQHERIFMLTKSKEYKWRYTPGLWETGNVWQILPNSSKKNSPAAMPDQIVRRCVLLSTDPGDVVLDPFAGSGTTVKVANDLGRVGIGVDLYGSKFL